MLVAGEAPDIYMTGVEVTKVTADDTFKSVVQKIAQAMQDGSIQPPTSTG